MEVVECDRFDFVLGRGTHGWSEFDLYYDRRDTLHLQLTHVPSGDPLSLLLEGTLQISAGETITPVFWHDEPGFFNWHIRRLQDDLRQGRCNVRKMRGAIVQRNFRF